MSETQNHSLGSSESREKTEGQISKGEGRIFAKDTEWVGKGNMSGE